MKKCISLIRLIEGILFYGFYIGSNTGVRLTKFFIKNLKKGQIFFDCGTNYWYYTLLVSRFVGNENRDYAFKPDTETLEFLERIKEKILK